MWFMFICVSLWKAEENLKGKGTTTPDIASSGHNSLRSIHAAILLHHEVGQTRTEMCYPVAIAGQRTCQER